MRECLGDNEKHHGPQRGQIANCTLLNVWPWQAGLPAHWCGAERRKGSSCSLHAMSLVSFVWSDSLVVLRHRCRWMSNSLGQRWCTALSAICPEKLCIFLLIYPSAFQVHLSSQDVWSQGNWRLVCSTQAKGMTLSTYDVVIVFSIQRSQNNSKARFFLGNTHTHLAIYIVWADCTTICIPLNCYCPLPKSSFSSCQSSFEVRLRPVIDGGGQERGMRSGTLATPPIVGFGAAAEVWIPRHRKFTQCFVAA